MADTETDAEIIDTVELTGLKDNQKYYLRPALVETTMNSESYGNAFTDASGKAVQAVGWRKRGKEHDMEETFSTHNAKNTPKSAKNFFQFCQK